MADKHDDPTLNLVSQAYGAAVDPAKFDDLLLAWDCWLDQTVLSPGRDFDPISSIFDNAVEVSSRFTEPSGNAPNNFELALAPAMLLDADHRVLSLNAAAKNFFAREELVPGDIVDAVSSPISGFEESGRPVFRVASGAGRRSVLAIDAPISEAARASFPSGHRMLLLSQIDWSASFEAELRDLLCLSSAELRVARGLLKGLTAQEMADELDRSLATIRTHIKILLQKSGARRQSELIQLLTILRHSFDLKLDAAAEPEARGEVLRSELVSAAGTLPVVRYGRGRPLLYFTTSSKPEETASVRRAFENAGFEVLAPVRPGYGDRPRAGVDANEEMLEDWLEALIDEFAEPPLIVGHREAGIVAVKAAKRLLAAGRASAGVALISTGAPVRRQSYWKQSPPSIRRSFVAATHAPAALSLGYQTAARLFRRGPREQEKLVRYFFQDSPSDAIRLSEPELFELTRANLEFCFRDPQQVVRDIALWGSAWADELAAVSEQLDVLFIHGTEHSFFLYQSVLECALAHARIHACPIPEAGQLALYLSCDRVAAALAETFFPQRKAV
ncbi:MAG: alpha/beta fold hydrolase [Pseudomonadota bacterium]